MKRKHYFSGMKQFPLLTGLVLVCAFAVSGQTPGVVQLFDGNTFHGWSGDTARTWQIRNHSLVGGSLRREVPHNEFLSTTESFGDFDLSLQFKLTGTGYVNGGIQFHSERLKNPPYEMSGYQADLGKSYWGSLYDESRRNVTIVRPDDLLISKILKPSAWNDYRIRSEGRRIRIWLNGKLTVDYTEPDEKISHHGLIALQVHGGGKTEASYRHIEIRILGR